MEDAFTNFDAAGAEPSMSFHAAPQMSSETQQVACPVIAPLIASRRTPAPAPLLSRISLVTWLILAGALLVIVTAVMYYYRRKQTTASKEADAVQTLSAAIKSIQHEVDVLAQQQNIMTSQIRSVATHSRSVEQGLGQALESWTGTIQQLRNEFEMLVVEEEEETRAAGQPEEERNQHEARHDGQQESDGEDEEAHEDADQQAS
jgi:uncharacterized protein YoxC